jgi:hypothetical protein
MTSAPSDVSGAVFLALVVAIAALASFAVFLGCFWWFRREQRRWQRKMLLTIAQAARPADELVVSSPAAVPGGELVAQFKVRQGKQVVSVFEADGRRFIHIDGELSAPERARMVRYLKSEGFMS